MIVAYSDCQLADADYPDFSVFDELLDDDCEDSYHLYTIIQEGDAQASTTLTE